MATQQDTTQQDTAKPAGKRVKTVRDVLPKRGFEYKQGRSLFARAYDSAAFKIALQQVTPNLHKLTVDQLLADLMKKAKEIKDPRESDHSVVFNRVGQLIPWTSKLKSGIVPEIMLCLVNARELHIKFTRMRLNTIDQSTEGKLAKAIDAYIGDGPAFEPEEKYKEMDKLNPKLIDNMMDRMRQGLGADWDQYSDYNSTDDEGQDKDDK